MHVENRDHTTPYISVKTTVLTGTEPELRPWTGHLENACGVQRRFFIYLYSLRNTGELARFLDGNQGCSPLAYHVICWQLLLFPGSPAARKKGGERERWRLISIALDTHQCSSNSCDVEKTRRNLRSWMGKYEQPQLNSFPSPLSLSISLSIFFSLGQKGSRLMPASAWWNTDVHSLAASHRVSVGDILGTDRDAQSGPLFPTVLSIFGSRYHLACSAWPLLASEDGPCRLIGAK